MTQIMKANPAKPMTFENPWENLREIIGLDQIAELVNADIIAVFSVVALAAYRSFAPDEIRWLVNAPPAVELDSLLPWNPALRKRLEN